MSGLRKRKFRKCLNCGTKVLPTDNYCPKCGQENRDFQLTFRELLNDFFHNYFALDSRFGRSFKPFFLKPGFLTIEFMKGKRMTYANPIRLYLVISVIHFFIFSINSGNESEDENPKNILNVGDTTYYDESGNKMMIVENDTVEVNFSAADTLDPFNIGRKIAIIDQMADHHTHQEIYDSLHLENSSYFSQLTWKQSIKVMKDGESSLTNFFLKNIPILMFFLLPVYALILKLFFQKKLYLNHAVHSLHLHSFLFIILTFVWLYYIIIDESPTLFFIAFGLASFYIIRSFMRSYEIRAMRAVLTLIGTGAVYTFVLALSLMITFIISFYTF
ncbi:MAG: DUF3667 domain-containing protein [Bacteroidota bacterium]